LNRCGARIGAGSACGSAGNETAGIRAGRFAFASGAVQAMALTAAASRLLWRDALFL
jgi:hypothetical protein